MFPGRRIGIAIACLALAVSASMFAPTPAFATDPFDADVLTQDEGAYAWVYYDGGSQFRFEVCDFAPDGHHARGTLTLNFDSKPPVSLHLREYDGYDDCEKKSISRSGVLSITLWAANYEGSTKLSESTLWIPL